MSFRNLVRNAIGKTLTGLSARIFRGSESPAEFQPSFDTSSHTQDKGQEATVEKSYNPKDHKAFYTVSLGVIRVLEQSSAPMTVKELAEATQYAASSIRIFSKEYLASEGILDMVVEYPATYRIADAEKAAKFAAECEAIVGPFVPPTAEPEAEAS